MLATAGLEVTDRLLDDTQRVGSEHGERRAEEDDRGVLRVKPLTAAVKSSAGRAIEIVIVVQCVMLLVCCLPVGCDSEMCVCQCCWCVLAS